MKRTLKNFLSLIVGDVVSRLIGFVATVYLARTLESSMFGVVNIGLSVFGYVFLLANPGIQVLEIRNAAAVEGADDRRVQAILSLRLVLALFLTLTTAVVTFLVHVSSPTREVTLLYCLALFPLSFFLDWFFQGKESFGLVSSAKIANALVYAVSVLAMVRTPDDVMLVPISFALGNVAATVLLLINYVHRFGWLRPAWQIGEWRKILTAGAPVGLATFLAQSAMNLPPIVIGWLVSNAAAGTFSAALKIIVVLLMIDRVLNALLLPAITRYFVRQRGDVEFFIATAIKLLLIVAVPLTLVGVLFAPLTISTVFGTKYTDAAVILQILMGYFFLTLLNSIFVCSLIASSKETEYTAVLYKGSALLAVAIVLGTVLAGSSGAAVGVVVGELFTMMLMMLSLLKTVRLPVRSLFVRHALAAAGAAVWPFLLDNHHVVTQASVSLVIFAILAFMLKLVGLEEVQFLRERVI